jgi:hypothetical protein
VRSCAVASASEALAIAVLEGSSFGGWELAEVNSFILHFQRHTNATSVVKN